MLDIANFVDRGGDQKLSTVGSLQISARQGNRIFSPGIFRTFPIPPNLYVEALIAFRARTYKAVTVNELIRVGL